MSGRLSRNIGFTLLPFAFLFLFEPGISIADPLPDCIGYVIICLAIRNLADINSRINDACNGFRKGALIGLLRIISIYILDSFFIESEQSVGLLLFSFVFSFFELAVLIPAYRCFFEGLLSLGITYDSSAVYYKKVRTVKRLRDGGEEYESTSESKNNLTEKAYCLTVCFLVVRAACMTLPEFTTLATNTSYEFVSLLRFFGILIALPVGLVWLIKMIVYCVKVKRDRPFIARLSELYLKNANEHPNLYVSRRVLNGLYSLLVAFVLFINIYSDYVDLVPGFLFYIVAIIASLFLFKYSKKTILLIITSVLGCVISFVSRNTTVAFHSEFYPAAVKKSIDAYNAYYKMFAWHIADSLISFVAVVFALMIIWDVFKVHSEIALSDTKKEYVFFKRQFLKGGICALILGVISCVSNIYYVFSQPFYQTEYWYFYYSSIISIAINVIFVFSICFFIGYIINAVKYRYRLDLLE